MIDADQADDRDKAETTLAAEYALIGAGFHRLASRAFLVTRYGLCRELPCLRSPTEFLAQMTGRA